MKDLKSIMYEKSLEVFKNKLDLFLENWKFYIDFIEYFKNEWCSEEKIKNWSAAYQPDTYTNMATNNYIESWHNQLKSIYLNRQRNRRCDRLMYILTEDVAIDIKMDITGLTLIIGTLK